MIRVKHSFFNFYFLPFQSRINFSTSSMAKSKFEYVRFFEQEHTCLKNSWIVVRIDGKNFHKFSELHDFQKPNDLRALKLMTRSAASVFKEFNEVCLAFGHSDEYSFVFKKKTTIFNRRTEKILSLVCSVFSSAYVFFWGHYFGQQKLLFPPAFDGRIVLYPSDTNLRDYISWRQADVHVNNLYNTCFWSLVLKKGLDRTEAEKKLRGTFSSDKNELLFSEFNINYNNELDIFRKGTVLVKKNFKAKEGSKNIPVVVPLHCDVIKDDFWDEHKEILEESESPIVDESDLESYYYIGSRKDLMHLVREKTAEE